jgi:hypothetical protein
MVGTSALGAHSLAQAHRCAGLARLFNAAAGIIDLKYIASSERLDKYTQRRENNATRPSRALVKLIARSDLASTQIILIILKRYDINLDNILQHGKHAQGLLRFE